MKLCSVGILSSCNCADTSFLDLDLKDYAPNVAQSNIVATLNGPVVSISIKTEDSISYVCGSADGFSYCGARTIKLVDAATGILISATNLPFITYNPAQKKIQVQSTLKTEVGKYSLKIFVTLDNIANDQDRLLNDTLTVTVICDCADSLLDTISLDYFKVNVEIGKVSNPITLLIP